MNNNQATLQKLEQMKFYGMARAFTNTMETGVKTSLQPMSSSHISWMQSGMTGTIANSHDF